MDYKYKPYIISADFDEYADTIDKSRWVASATVDIGDKNGPRYRDKRLLITKKIDRVLFGKGHEGNQKSLGYIFTFLVCSKEFKANPTDEYRKYTSIMLVQNEYNRHEAEQWLKTKVEAIGDVTELELTNRLHTFLESEEWDFDQK